MNLTRDDQGKVLLAGEPIAGWFEKRNFYPSTLSYFLKTDLGWRLCLVSAMAYATVEDQTTIADFQVRVHLGGLNVLSYLAEMLGISREEASDLEVGFRGSFGSREHLRLGFDARTELAGRLDEYHVLRAMKSESKTNA